MKKLSQKPEKPKLGDFTAYFTAAAGLYHLLPLVAVIAFKENAIVFQTWILLLILPIFNVASGFFAGFKFGFCIKLALIYTVLFFPSIIMYYNDVTTIEELKTAVASTVVNTAICFIFTAGANFLGGIIKRLINGV